MQSPYFWELAKQKAQQPVGSGAKEIIGRVLLYNK
jgi:hypothetical protein